ncbi:MAG: aminotransferase class III-fold pyridoxal phosphate-dependent enzyme, partial [Ilumatobacteraceae bacterium]
PFARPTRDDFISLDRGEGAVVWDVHGNEYLDAMGSLWYCAIGHGRREMADAIAAQVMRLESYSCFDPFTNPWADALAERLVSLTPIPDARVFLCQSGSESVDTAMKLARVAHVQAGHPERTLIISRTRGYHGTNYGGTSAQGLAGNKVGWGGLLPDVVQVPSDDVEAVARLMSERSGEVAAVITEPVQGAAGVFPPEPGYLEALRRLCDQHGAFLVFDEVITGFGRLGEWFAADFYGVIPDITTFAKAVTSGYQPLGGVFVGAAVRAPIEADPDFKLTTGYTYSGHATACVAALTNIDIIEREGLLARATQIGLRLGAGFHSIAADGLVDHARGEGAMWAVGMHPGQDANVLRGHMLDAGIICRPIADHSLTFCPPLVTSDEQIDSIIDALAAAAAEEHHGTPRRA